MLLKWQRLDQAEVDVAKDTGREQKQAPGPLRLWSSPVILEAEGDVSVLGWAGAWPRGTRPPRSTQEGLRMVWSSALYFIYLRQDLAVYSRLGLISLWTVLSQPPQCWADGCIPPCLAMPSVSEALWTLLSW